MFTINEKIIGQHNVYKYLGVMMDRVGNMEEKI